MPTNEPISDPNQDQKVSESPLGNVLPVAEAPTSPWPIVNRNRPKWWLAGLVVLLFGAAGGVAGRYYQLNQQEVNPQPTPPTPPVEEIVTEPPTVPSSVFLADGVIEANEQFAFDLYAKYKSEEGNLFFSPYSISSALAMTYEGAKGKTAEEMQAVLHLPDDQERIRADFASINNELNKADKAYELTTANALWAQEDYPFVEDYFNVVAEYYGGQVTNLDFTTDTEKSRVTINNWVEDKTNDKIKDLIPEGVLTPMTRLVLTNAIYFKADWDSQFEAKDTRDGPFQLDSGQSVTAPMMRQTNDYNYGETGNLQILEMDYRGDDLSMLIILPKDGYLNQVEDAFNQNKLSDWKSGMGTEEVRVILPKFTFETKYFMAKDLQEMGMPTAFIYPGADFTGMSPTGELYIDEVIHQTFVEVAEYGTEAAAATAVVMEAGGVRATDEPKIFNADHPFIFIIQQKDSGNILFMGRLSDPTQP